MAPRDTIHLCLVLCLSQKLCAQEGYFPIPIISATPGSVIPWNESVKILCWGTPESYLYQLEILRNPTFEVVEKKLGFQEKAEFLISHMNTNTAGRYQCQYRKEYKLSEHSKTLELVVTGLYDKPSLSAVQSMVVILGENISLQCSSTDIPFDRFSLTKEGGATLSQHQNGVHQGNFILGPVNHNFSGNYRCYGWYSGSPYVWSAPSDALGLVVTDIMNQDYTMENLIRMGVAGLVLVALLAIVIGNWHSHKVPNKEDWPDFPELSRSKHKCQTGPLDKALRDTRALRGKAYCKPGNKKTLPS
ncbi:immunoglobulin alpha Fc receptor-like isoform X2 [Lynx canadensis]|uniref:immunoglobulin alpha Fc receptor-like isoform X2 n=2 Tax=Lynx canadensis TaxID=61383 RepID=UPI0011B0B1E6|nr:immunoglobulin alpha Fc receptor-like isoform X2 [Lynx canadensis]